MIARSLNTPENAPHPVPPLLHLVGFVPPLRVPGRHTGSLIPTWSGPIPHLVACGRRGVRILCEANGFSSDATELLVSMLEPQPSRRISAADILASAWAQPSVLVPPVSTALLAPPTSGRGGRSQLPGRARVSLSAAGPRRV